MNMRYAKEEEIDNFEKSNEEKLNGDIEIKNLTYNYPGYIETVLENIYLIPLKFKRDSTVTNVDS